MGKATAPRAPRAPRNPAPAPVLTAATLGQATLTGEQAASFLPLAARTVIDGKAVIATEKAKGTAALAVMTAGLACDETAARVWTFDIAGAEGAIHTHVTCDGFAQFGCDDLAWMRNSEGKVSRVAQSAYKAAFQATFFNLPEPNAAVWTMASKAVAMARAIRAEGMTATLEGGKLVLSGGTSDKAQKMRDASSLAALGKVAGDETGTNRKTPQNNGGGEGESTRAATPEEILSIACRLCENVTEDREALSNAALSYARRIAALVVSKPEAFADE